MYVFHTILNIMCFSTKPTELCSLYSGRYAYTSKVETETYYSIDINFMPHGIPKHQENDPRGRNGAASSGFHRSCYCLQGNGFRPLGKLHLMSYQKRMECV
jgi:hypothetical protein